MIECCASGSCEVCRPGFFGNDTPTRDDKGQLPADHCSACGGAMNGAPFRRLPWGVYCSPGCADG